MAQVLGTGKYDRLLERCKSLKPVVTAVAYPCEGHALSGAIEAGKLACLPATNRRPSSL